MDIKGYKIGKHGGWQSTKAYTLDNPRDALMYFLRHFPRLADDFFNAKTIVIKQNDQYHHFIEQEIIKRLQALETPEELLDKYGEQGLSILRKAYRLQHHQFKGVTYEINTFGPSEGEITIGLLEIFKAIEKSDITKGLKIKPKTAEQIYLEYRNKNT